MQLLAKDYVVVETRDIFFNLHEPCVNIEVEKWLDEEQNNR